jgi:hypothetical protein
MVRNVAEVTLSLQQRSVPSWGISWECCPPTCFFGRSPFLSRSQRKTACESLMGNSDDDYNGGQLVVVAVIFLVLTYLSVFLRFFVRLVITKSFSADDWLMLAAQVFRILATCREAQTHILTDCFYAFLLFHSQRCARWTRQTQSQPPSRKQNQST